MPQFTVEIPAHDRHLAAALLDLHLRHDLESGFSDATLSELAHTFRSYELPAEDRRDIPLITIDPPESMDLDQALAIEEHGEGYLVSYAIADVPAFVPPDGKLDQHTLSRGLTFYTPNKTVPLHPQELSEGVGSLLPAQDRGAYLWQFVLDAAGNVTSGGVRRATVRSIAKLGYPQAQRELDRADPVPYQQTLTLLKAVGLKRLELERQRGGASLTVPTQRIERDLSHGYRLSLRASLPIEAWNAQISLMTGMEAARMMLSHKVGLLRTLPQPSQGAVAEFRRQADALKTPWPPELSYGEFLRTLDTSKPRHLALMHAATALFRGAGYTAFDGKLPELTTHAAVAAAYTHTTAPLRRLVDRFCLTLCEAFTAGREVPEWVRAALPSLPAAMAAASHKSSTVEHEGLDILEAAVMTNAGGQQFDAVVLSVGRPHPDGKGKAGECAVQLVDPPVTARCRFNSSAPPAPGDRVRVRVVKASIEDRLVQCELSG